MIPKKIFPPEKMHYFLKVSTICYKEISEIISTIVMKKCQKSEIKKMHHIYSKSLNLLIQNDIIINYSFSQQKKIILLGTRRKKKSFFVPIFRNVTRYKTPARERAFFAFYSPNSYYCFRDREQILSFQLHLMESETAHICLQLMT